MNIGEANEFFWLVRALGNPPEAPDDRDRLLDAVEHLTAQGNKALMAGPRPDEVRRKVAAVLDVLVAAKPRPFKTGDRVKIGKGKRVWVLKGRACPGGPGCEHWDATVEDTAGYVNRMVEAGQISLVTS